MGFIESLLGSGLANAIALHSVAGAFKEASINSYVSEEQFTDIPRAGIQKELFERAEKAIKSEQYIIALPLLIRALKLDPRYFYYYSALGICYQNLGNIDIALECYDKALDLVSKSLVQEYNIWEAKLANNNMDPKYDGDPKIRAQIRVHEKYVKSIRNLTRKCENDLGRTIIEEVSALTKKTKQSKRIVHPTPKTNTRKNNH
jgi:tetratricopeptide (TPR) repeat protein